MTGVSILMVTVPTEKEAKIIARKLVDEQLVKCVNIMPVESFYVWKEEHHEQTESLMIIKINEHNYEKVEELVNKLHSYDVPEILGLPVVKGSKPYLDWMLS
ncbi:divalent-cation tolerance protein CutA [archaeon]|nr:divalent-cation tolerance protein CutA [archaeon]